MRHIKRIVLHHLGNNPQKSGVFMQHITLAMIQSWHKSRFNVDKIQYHYVIFPNGTIKHTRKDEEVTWHCGNYNKDSIGIALVGDFEQEEPTIDQLRALRDLLVRLCKEYSNEAESIVTHRNLSPTLCPGKNLVRELPNLIFKISRELRQDPIDLSGLSLIRSPSWFDKILDFLWGFYIKIRG